MEREITSAGYGYGYYDGWHSVTCKSSVPSQMGTKRIYPAPVNMTLYAYGYEKGRLEALKAKLWAPRPSD